MRVSVTLLLLFFSATSFAVPVKWDLQDVYLGNGAQVTGSFVYDADTPVNSCALPGEVFPTCSVSVPDAYSDFEFQILQTNNNTISFTELNSDVYYWDSWTGEILTDNDSLEVKCTDCDPTFSGVDFYLGFVFYPGALTNAGGVVPLYDTVPVSFQATSGWRTEVNGETFGYSEIVSGSVVGTVVPLPAAVWLFGSALAGLGWLRRRH